jgi:hypothetical protein
VEEDGLSDELTCMDDGYSFDAYGADCFGDDCYEDYEAH